MSGIENKKPNKKQNEEITKMFRALETAYMNNRTEDFVHSLMEFFHTNGFLTNKQFEALKKVYERID